jgi:hypothetical protein
LTELIALVDAAVQSKISGKRVRGLKTWRLSPERAVKIEAAAVLDGTAV